MHVSLLKAKLEREHTKLLPNHDPTPVIRIEVHVERIHYTIPFINYYDHASLLISRSPTRVRLDAIQPIRVLGDVDITSEVDIGPTIRADGV